MSVGGWGGQETDDIESWERYTSQTWLNDAYSFTVSLFSYQCETYHFKNIWSYKYLLSINYIFISENDNCGTQISNFCDALKQHSTFNYFPRFSLQHPRCQWHHQPEHAPSSSIQFSSVAQSCPTLCNPMNCSMPGLPVYHQLPEFTQTHVPRVSDAIQPSHPLSSPFPPAPNPSQNEDLFQWVNSSHEVAKGLEFQL